MMKRDNRGLSLVELIIAMAITVIIMGAATFFIRTSIKNYQMAASTVDLQMESQIVMEQLVTWVMEGEELDLIDYTDSEGNTVPVLVIYDEPSDIIEKNVPAGFAPNGYHRQVEGNLSSPIVKDVTMRVIWSDGKDLYMVKNTNGTQPDIVVANATEKNRVGEYIDSFTVVLNADKTKATIKMSLKEGTQQYDLTNSASVRGTLYQLENTTTDSI